MANLTLCGWEYCEMERLNLSNFTRMCYMSYFKVATCLNFPPKNTLFPKIQKHVQIWFSILMKVLWHLKLQNAQLLVIQHDLLFNFTFNTYGYKLILVNY